MHPPYSDLTSEEIGQAIRAFRAETCPFCDGEKMHIENPFCCPCLDLLTPELHAAMHDHAKFLEAYHPAMKHLAVSKGRGRDAKPGSPVSD